MPMSTASPRIAARIGTRATVLTGTGLFGGGMALMAAMVSLDGGYWSIAPGLMVLAVGMGLVMTPSTTAITEALPKEKQGVASALNDTVRELGGAFGVALLGSVLSSGYRSSIATTAEGLPAELRRPVEDGIGTALATSGRLGMDAPAIVDAARQAFVDGWQTSMWVGAALAAVGFAYVALRGPAEPTSAVGGGDVEPQPAQRDLGLVPADA